MWKWTQTLERKILVEKRVQGSLSRVLSRREPVPGPCPFLSGCITGPWDGMWPQVTDFPSKLAPFPSSLVVLMTHILPEPGIQPLPWSHFFAKSEGFQFHENFKINCLLSPRGSNSMRILKFILSSLSSPPFSYFRPSDSFLGLWVFLNYPLISLHGSSFPSSQFVH